MENRIEKIIEKIENSFNTLNTSIELIKKAEKTTTTVTKTTSNLINEFQTTIDSIETLVKSDFANEYNKLVKKYDQLISEISKIDFEKNFIETNKKIEKKNFDANFKSITKLINEKSKEIFEFVNSNNEFLESFQSNIFSIPQKFKDLERAINSIDTEVENTKINLENQQTKNFEELCQMFNKQGKEIKKIKNTVIIIGFIIIGILSLKMFF